MQHPLFHLAKAFLPLLGKDVGNLLVEAAFDVVVKVVELHPHVACKHLTDGGLACAHIPYQHHAYHALVVLLPRRDVALLSGCALAAFSISAIHSS